MRILLVNFEFPPVGGGGANAAFYISRELVRQGHQVDVLTSRFRGLKKEENIDGVRVIRVPVIRKRLDYSSVKEMASFAVSTVPYAIKLAAQNKYDVVHVFFGVPCGHIGWLLKKVFGIPYLISLRGGDVPGFKPHGYEKHYRRLTPVIKHLWNDCDALVAVSQGLRYQALLVHPDAKEIQVIPNGVNTQEFTPAPHQAGHPVNILVVSRLIRRKGIEYLIEAASLLQDRTKTPFQITIAGDGIYRHRLEGHVKQRGLEKRVTFLGSIDHDKLPAVYRSADIFCLPSLAEGMSNVLLEALSSGLPLVSTKTSGSTELIHPHVNGFLVDIEDAADLADHLLPLIEDSSLREKFGRASREAALTYSWKTISKHYQEIYSRIRHG